ncbi:hypothetical protein HWQ46_15185 [Shewanella sp. D64]|uniref:hypothetical protein n=1 Tax=unclassified Shewanella TaxID=196818 RepID=UPI0022BA6D7B|nr:MULTISPECIES: hypothetical protein [unclassified Shewanella]MEC4726895.1 hypothetical protein [Shewanella sp. D64]MEC4738608.1 hypothetical protein [Shewanella sp. E94]WBJ93825.1 hypothetical protein HWQ47_18080 [Shewanella sp. MTB7]
MRFSIRGDQPITVFQITAVFSMIFALIGFSYNVWRMEITEYNSNMRSASFELLLQLSELEGIIYAAHYDQNIVEGNPRKGWIKVNLIADLSMIAEPEVSKSANALKMEWQENWQTLNRSETSAMNMVGAIDNTRDEVRHLLSKLN